jgi:ParB family chromosome partitioning protein
MKPLGLQTIPLAQIDVSGRLRQVDPDHAALLAENIRQTGHLRQPPEVRKLKKGGFKLIAGGHRLAAAGLLGWTEIEAFVFELGDDEARLAEIDENLVRHDLNPLDRAVFLAERKALYEKLHPDTVAGVAGGKARQGSATEIISFARDTAERCGITERAVQLSVMIASRLAPEIRARIAGTWVAKKQSELLALVKVEPSKRLAVLDLVLGDDAPANTVKAALRLVDGASSPVSDDREKKLAALRKAWDRGGAKVHRAWLRDLMDEDRLDELLKALAEAVPLSDLREMLAFHAPQRAPAKPDPAQIDLEDAIAARAAAEAEA